MKIETNHKIVGLKNSNIGTVNLGSYYPVLAEDLETIVGVYSAEHGTPVGYKLDNARQAYVLDLRLGDTK